MTDLPPVCRLCKFPAFDQSGFKVCGHIPCKLYAVEFTEEQWRKLMYVPKKKEYSDDPKLPLFESDYYIDGYNAAIDDMLKGGE